jgi:hypothetical protein
LCDYRDFRDLCDFCDIHASMDITFASGWTTPAGAHAFRMPFLGLAPKSLIAKSRPRRRTSRPAGDAIIMLPIKFHSGGPMRPTGDDNNITQPSRHVPGEHNRTNLDAANSLSPGCEADLRLRAANFQLSSSNLQPLRLWILGFRLYSRCPGNIK